MITVVGFLEPPAGHPLIPKLPGLAEYQIMGIRLVVTESDKDEALEFVDRYLRENRRNIEGLADFEICISAK